MGRDPRIEFKGAIYHVIQRGNNKEFVFNEDVDKGYFLKRFEEAKEEMGFDVFSYVIMDNHYHFLLRTNDEPLNKIMHQVNSIYSKFYNYKYMHLGHVFQGRYTAILVQDESYFLRLISYIHQNPIRAHMCSHIYQYKWNSDIFYRKNRSGFVDIDTTLNILSPVRGEAIKKYRDAMEKTEKTDYDNVKIVGDDAFKESFNANDKTCVKKGLDEILLETGVPVNGFTLIKDGSKERWLTQYKVEFIKKCLENKYPIKEIAASISITNSAVHSLIKRLCGDRHQ